MEIIIVSQECPLSTREAEYILATEYILVLGEGVHCVHLEMLLLLRE